MVSGILRQVLYIHFQCLGLFNLQTWHEPAELLPGGRLYLIPIAWPPETTLYAAIQTFVQQAHAVRFFDKNFYAVTPFSTEKVDGHGIRLCMEHVLDRYAQTIY